MSLLRVENVSVAFPVSRRNGWPWQAPLTLQAVSDVSLEVAAGETLGLVGESGSGKSTLARAILGTVPTSDGVVRWRGEALTALSPTERRRFGRDIQMVFQDPLAALNPRMTIGEIVAEPLRTHMPEMTEAARKTKVMQTLERVGLLASQLNRYPHEFSGGQCQRIGIARALVTDPQLVICDEPVSALDVSVQAQVVNLLQDLQREMGLSLLFIAHDLSVVQHVSTRIAVMYLGRLVEEAPARALIADPKHPYTQALIAAAPIPSPAAERARQHAPLPGDLPSPFAPPSGCVFRTRCPLAEPQCAEARPALVGFEDQRRLACGPVQQVLQSHARA
jgi:oligopeptide transport system ATP-binding protein